MAHARVVDQCRSTQYLFDHHVDLVVDYRDNINYQDNARFKRDMQVLRCCRQWNLNYLLRVELTKILVPINFGSLINQLKGFLKSL